MTDLFHELPILDELGASLAQGYRRAEAPSRLPRPGLRLLVPAVALFVLLGGGAAAATLLVLRGSVIPGPAPENVQPQMTPLVRTVHVEPVHAADPAGGAPWSVRIARSETGLVCTTAGQVDAGRFGIVGLDGRFRTLAPSFVDGCGAEGAGRALLVGARVFYSPKVSLVRTVIDGIAGPSLKSAVLEREFKPPRQLPVSADGAFVGVFAGYPEDVGARVVLRFADGHTEARDLGRSPYVVPDPVGGRAWRAEGFTIGNVQPRGTSCVAFSTVRPVSPSASGPPVCGPERSDGYFFSVRRFEPGDHRRSGLSGFDWGAHPARTVVWGAVGDDVRSLSISGPTGVRRIPLAPSHAFVAIYPPRVRPADLTIIIHLPHGSTVRRKGSTNVIPFPGFGAHHR